MSELNKLSAKQATEKLAAGEITATALVEACLTRIAERDSDVRAWSYLDTDHALEQAQRADAAIRSGADTGPLHGIPIGVKDIIDTADMPTEHGSPIFEGRRPTHDATCVAALRAAGAIILGKTVTTELANLNPNKTRNPHNLAHTPGGSSSGSAAGVADWQMPLALGTQTGGSVIRPASFNGIYGLKPTLGLIPRGGVLLQSHTLDTVGVYGRTLHDLARITDVLSFPEPADRHSFTGSRAKLEAAYGVPPPRPPRFAFLRTPAWPHADNEAQTAIEKFAESLGERCVRVDLPEPFDRIVELHLTVMGAENAAYYGHFLDEQPDLLSELLRARLTKSKAVTGNDYVKALNAREAIYADLATLLADYDAVVCPASAGPAPHSLDSTGTAIFNGLWTYLGVPCISLPLLRVRGMPMGVQLVGRRGEEARLFRTARWLDESVGQSG